MPQRPPNVIIGLEITLLGTPRHEANARILTLSHLVQLRILVWQLLPTFRVVAASFPDGTVLQNGSIAFGYPQDMCKIARGFRRVAAGFTMRGVCGDVTGSPDGLRGKQVGRPI